MTALRIWYLCTEILILAALGVAAYKDEWQIAVMILILLEVRAIRVDGLKP